MAGDTDANGADVKISRFPVRSEQFHGLPKEVRNLLAGGIAGMTAKSIVAPIDRIKIMYQVSSAKFRLRDVPGVAYKIIQAEGVTALWKGNFATMIRVFPYSGIQFMVFDRCKSFFLHRHDHEQNSAGPSSGSGASIKKMGLSPFESLISGSIAGAVSVVATYPLDLTRAQLAVLKKKKRHVGSGANKGFISVLVGNYQNRGFRGLFRGVTPTLLGILPYSGVAFTINEQAKREIQIVTGRQPTTIERMQCGALSGLVAQSMTYPLEVTRRRMQTIGIVPTSGGDAAVNVLGGTLDTSKAVSVAKSAVPIPPVSSPSSNPESMVHTMRRLFHEQGLRGFFKGVAMNWLKGPIAFSISFTAYDIVKAFMATDYEKSQ